MAEAGEAAFTVSDDALDFLRGSSLPPGSAEVKEAGRDGALDFLRRTQERVGKGRMILDPKTGLPTGSILESMRDEASFATMTILVRDDVPICAGISNIACTLFHCRDPGAPHLPQLAPP